VLFSPDRTLPPETSYKAFTVNLSLGGVFLHTMETFEEGTTLWLRFLELADQTPIAATARWSLEWGEARCIPGIGMKFDGLSEGQEKEIRRILYL
jgi:Tfp pilus assembly protein PilZ